MGIAGEANYQPAIQRCRVGQEVELRPEPTNAYDRRAIVVLDTARQRTVIDTPLPAGFAALDVPSTALQFSPEEVASQRSGWISQWQRAVSR